MRTYEQAGGILGRNRELVGEIKNVVRQFLPTADVLLYGSVARGTQEPASDYDILVLTNEPVPREDEKAVEHAILGLELRQEVVISTIYYSRDEWEEPLTRVSPFHDEVERDAIVL